MKGFKGKFHSHHDFDWSLVWNSCLYSLRFSFWPYTLCSSGLHPGSLIWFLAFLCSFAILDFTQKNKTGEVSEEYSSHRLWLMPLCRLIHNFLYYAFFFIRKKKFWFRNSWHIYLLLISDMWELRKLTPLRSSLGTVVLTYCFLNPEIYALSGRARETVEELTMYPATSQKARSVLIHMVTWAVFKWPFREHICSLM